MAREEREKPETHPVRAKYGFLGVNFILGTSYLWYPEVTREQKRWG